MSDDMTDDDLAHREAEAVELVEARARIADLLKLVEKLES